MGTKKMLRDSFIMTELKEMKKLKTDFQHASSRMMSSKYDEDSIYVERFVSFVEQTPFLCECLQSATKKANSQYNVDKFLIRVPNSNKPKIAIPRDGNDHIKGMWELLKQISRDNTLCALSVSICSTYGQRGDVIIQNFLKDTFSDIIAFFNRNIDNELNSLDAEMAKTPTYQQIITYNGEVVSATPAMGETVTINNCVNENDVKNVSDFINKLCLALNNMGIEKDAKGLVEKNLTDIRQQVSSKKPEKSIIKKAVEYLQGITSKLGENTQFICLLNELIKLLAAMKLY